MPMKPGARSCTNAGFSRWLYGVDHGAPNADQWNWATTIAQGNEPSRTPRQRPVCITNATIKITAAGADGYSIATAAVEKNPTRNGRHFQKPDRYAAPSASAAS